jgi:protease IV
MILLRLIGLLLDLLFLPLRVLARARAVLPGSFLTVTIDGPVADLVERPRFWQVKKQHATSLHALSLLVDAAIADPRVRGLVVTIRSLATGMAGAASLRRELARLRAAGKEVVVHLPMGGGTKEVFVASVATKCVVGPSTQLAPLGFLSRTRYLKSALDKAGVEAEVFACGDYKSAGESLVRDSMSDAQREQLDRMLDRFHRALVEAIAEGRGVSAEDAARCIDGAPYFGEKAVLAGLADAVAYEDELPGLLGVETKGPSVRGFVDGARYLARAKRPLLRRLLRRPVIAVIPVHGAIAHAAGVFGGFSTDERVTRMVRLARLDRRIQGVILHVDSPGGSALASDLMHHEIAQLARQKPVVTCMANVAASGGYYVAAPTHKIVCEALTITGSIGVVAVRAGLEPLLDRLGVRTETLQRGARAGLLSPTHRMTDDERLALRGELDATYRAFVGVVAAGRKMTEEAVEPLARGRVYTGDHAASVGLVDRLGGFDTALRELRAMLPEAIRDRAEPHLLRLPRRRMPAPAPPDAGEAGHRAALALASGFLSRGGRAAFELALRGERILAICPEADLDAHG